MRTFLKVLGFVAGFAVVPALAQAETLADALASAYKSSNLLDQNQAVLRAADEDAAIAMSNLRPVLNFVTSGGWRQYDQTITSLGDDNAGSGSRLSRCVSPTFGSSPKNCAPRRTGSMWAR